MKKIIIFALIFGCANLVAKENSHNHHRVDYHAPSLVMRDHVHNKGEFMMNIVYAQMKMDGAINNDDKVSKEQILQNFMMAPKSMVMKMMMLGGMYGVSDNFTLAGNLNYTVKRMVSENRAGVESKNEFSDLNDAKINTLFKLNEKLQLNLGFSLPIGENDEKINALNAPYPMQNGSGSYEFLPGISFKSIEENYSYGAQINLNFKLNKNDNNYKFGDYYNFTSWVAKPISKNFSLSSRLDYTIYEAIEGRDAALDSRRNMSPAFRNNLGDGQKLYGFVGFNFLADDKIFHGYRFNAEFGLPLYQRIDGPVLRDDYKFGFNIQKTF